MQTLHTHGSGRIAMVRTQRDRPESPGAGTSAPAIETRALTRDYPGVRAVDDLSLSVPRGSIFGFLGRNGAGKTTTIRLLLGLQTPTSGSARVLGFDPVGQPREVRRRCGVLLEHSGLIERLSAADNLDIHARICRMPRLIRDARVEELLSRIGLWDRRNEVVRGWSRGMKQRLAIARAMLPRPLLLFLDEPTAGLDPVAASELRDNLLSLATRERVTVFLTTHNLAEAERLCDQVAVVREGRLLDVGAPTDIGRRHSTARLRVSGHGFTPNLLELLRGRGDVLAVREALPEIEIDLPEGADPAALVTFIVRLGAQVDEVRRVGTTLEDGVLSLFARPVRTASPLRETLRRNA